MESVRALVDELLHAIAMRASASAMATVVDERHAVTVASALPIHSGRWLLRTAKGVHVRGNIVFHDAAADLAVLEIDPLTFTAGLSSRLPEKAFTLLVDAKPYPPGTPLELTIGGDGEPFVLASEVLPQPDLLRGAPVVDQQSGICGIVGALRSEGGQASRQIVGRQTWSFIPAEVIASVVQGATRPEETRRRGSSKRVNVRFDEASFFRRLNESARQALRVASGYAGGGAIHTEDLFLGLYANPSGSARRLFRGKGIDASKLFVALKRSESSEPVLPPMLTELPAISRHTRDAFRNALDAAGDDGSIRSRHLLKGLLSLQTCDVVERLIALGVSPDAVRLESISNISGHRADTADGTDLLSIGREVNALTTLLAARTVEPPISLGLFGNWGTGKSFFMREMKRSFEQIEQSRDPAYCGNIIQIWFNAWHYIDTNLWASLTSEIFEALDRELTRRQKPEQPKQNRAELLAQAAQSRADAEKAAKERADAEADLDRMTRDGANAREVVAAVLEVAAGDADAKKTIEQAKQLHLTVADVQRASGFFGKAKASLTALSRKKWRTLLLLAGLAVSALAAWEWKPIAGIIGGLGSLLVIAGPVVNRVRKFADVIERTTQAREAALRTRIDRARRQEEAAQRLHDETMASLEPKRQMANFIRERRESADYKKYLGVIASAHDDFEHLTEYFANLNAAPGPDGAHYRIVIYIDDLDRCPENKVVDVLQAVHLLLAFKLFIVVVGVDSRWLLHSLQQHLKAFEKDGEAEEEEELWTSTPLNYLEKIFQIPFTLRPMDSTGFGELVQNLTLPEEEPPPPKTNTPDAPKKPIEPAPLPAPQPVESPAPSPPPPVAPEPLPQPVAASERPVAKPVDTPAPVVERKELPRSSFLKLESWEIEFMKRLYPLMTSPRAAKRFVNTYRIIRVMVDDYERDAFVGTAAGGDYQAVLLLLAMLGGYPEQTSEIIRDLLESEPTAPWWSYFDSLVASVAGPEQKPWTTFSKKMECVRDAGVIDAARSCEAFVRWAPEVGRYSFHSGRVVAAEMLGSTIVSPTDG